VSAPLLELRDLRITYPGPPPVRAVDDLTLTVRQGECLGVLGESGSGKSTLARSLLGLLAEAEVEGALRLDGTDLGALDEGGWRGVRWRRIALVFQSTSALNPVLRIGTQITEALETHLDLGGRAAQRRAAQVLDRVGLGADAADRYPSELSGGQRRLALLSIGLACDPEILVLDEPTAGLDPLRRRVVLDLLADLRTEQRTLVVFTHDVDSLRLLADRVGVLYRGWLAELGAAGSVLEDPRNPYTWGLLNAYPTLGTVKDLRGIRGDPPDPTSVAGGCPFLERCPQSITDCEEGRPPEVAPDGEDGRRVVACVRGGVVPVVVARDLAKRFHVRRGVIGRETITAVDGVSLVVRAGEVLGLVGPTGAGKSTVGQLLLRLLDADEGSVEIEGRELLTAGKEGLKAVRRRAQMLFQDPFEALSPRLTVRQVVREPLEVQGIGTRVEQDELIAATMRAVRLPPVGGFLERHTHELSGGQLQRVALARALVLEPSLLIADEAVAMLDPSEQTKLLQLLKHLQVERGMAMVFISHELAVVLRVADRVVVLDRGRVVEEATSTGLLVDPQHPVTRRLLAASGARVAQGAAGEGALALPGTVDAVDAAILEAEAMPAEPRSGEG
jgi:peptide/nickel transport system ATP-binding protein